MFQTLMPLLAAATEHDATPEGELIGAVPVSLFTGPLLIVIDIGLALMLLGIALCLVRMLRGPGLADRITAADTIALNIVGLVTLLTVRIGSPVFIDVALTVGIIGFVTTIAFSQYIIAINQAEAEA